MSTDDRVAGPRRMLVVCTANVCRSPVAEAILARRLANVVDLDGRRWTVASAGTDRYHGPLEPDTVAAAAALGLDISSHVPRQVTDDDLDEADLVLTMTLGTNAPPRSTTSVGMRRRRLWSMPS